MANYLGFTVLTVPVAALSAAWLWVLAYWLKRAPFIASFFMTAALSAGHVVSSSGDWLAAAGAAAIFALIVFNHRKNIREY